MATKAKCGWNGSIGLGGEITKWDFVDEQETPDCTSMASGGYREYIPCLQSASGSFESLTLVGSVGSQLAVTFVNDMRSYQADIIITDIQNVVDVADKIVFRYSWVSTGQVH